MKLNEKKKIYGDASPLTLGEMMLFYDCTALNALKKYEDVIETSKLFITNYPTSFYFQSIKMNLEQAIKELEHRSIGKKGIDTKLSAESLDAYVEYLNKLEWKSNLQFVSEKEYKNYLNLYKSQVLDTKKETLDVWDESMKFVEFTNFFDVAAQFNDTKTMEDIVSVSKKLFIEADDQDHIFSLENKVDDFKTKAITNSEKINELENTAKKGSKADLEKVIKWHFSNEQYNRPDLLLTICNRYIAEFKPSSESDMAICLDAWDALITNTSKLKGLDEAKKMDETLKGKADDFKTVKTDYDKTVREIHQDIKNLQNDFTNYQKNVINNDPMISVLEKYATIYKDNNQYTEEAYTRKQLMNLFKLDADKEQLQLFLLAMCYYNLGYFDNVQKTATVLKEKYPTSTYTESINSITSYMPQ